VVVVSTAVSERRTPRRADAEETEVVARPARRHKEHGRGLLVGLCLGGAALLVLAVAGILFFAAGSGDRAVHEPANADRLDKDSTDKGKPLAKGQTSTESGVVTDSSKGAKSADAAVKVGDLSKGTAKDKSGFFKGKTPPFKGWDKSRTK
jgi:hypothetical protein